MSAQKTVVASLREAQSVKQEGSSVLVKSESRSRQTFLKKN
jgi:hypothetical protein